MDMSKSEGPITEEYESNPRSGESSIPEKGLDEREDSSLERAPKLRSAANQSSNPSPVLPDTGEERMSLLKLVASMLLRAYLPTKG
jgi:hypothetical protein